MIIPFLSPLSVEQTKDVGRPCNAPIAAAALLLALKQPPHCVPVGTEDPLCAAD